ncbi:ribosomal protein S12 (mitochondrion) [Fonticula alba]|uniref:Ribosomal protein S12 n=1 Tax=Fonticula alba TaxID=691883 RepID=A0A058YYW2_FONAL|nr:ribosomal protein S12 [Fonticula alba]KCV67184.1 ribosomal protein S12 [Fonticula alba]|eukprot:XP_009498407.1 ribosomal protein S12 (mitochondrion) [Fonticula alba]
MLTFNQCVKFRVKKKKNESKSPLLNKCPQRKGICTSVFIAHPKKPNSANRKVATVRFTTGFYATAAIKGIGHNLQEHGYVLIRGGRIKDLPGVNYTLVRGKFDLAPVLSRKRGRSKYGRRVLLNERKKQKYV